MLGYGMGGGFRIGRKSAADSRDEAAARGNGAAGQKTGLHNGTTRTADDTLSDQIAARRIPWTRERLLKTLGSIHHEPDELHAVRFGMKLTEQLGAEDFPLVFDALEEAIKGTGNPNRSNENDALRMKLREFAIVRWAELNPEAAAEYVKTLQHDIKNSDYPDIAALCGVWANSDPAAALKWVKTLPKEKGEQSAAFEFIIGAVAHRDVDAALALARAEKPGSLTDGGFGYVIANAAGSNDPEQTARKMAEIGSADGVRSAAGMWASKDHDAALKWAQGIPDEKIRESALAVVWNTYANEHPDEAAVLLSKLPAGESNGLAQSARNVASQMMNKDPEGTVRWAAGLQNPDARKSALWPIGYYYGHMDFDAGLQWLDTVPAGAERDSATSGFVNSGINNPQMRGELVATIENPEMRRNMLQNLFANWSRKDSATATEWFQKSPNISDEDRQAILKKK